ncbi:MAG: type VI secretion protein [Ruminococcus sp.]|nr:type VI secretion protein [Ruminococcus sp.]MDE6847729.1 type VI secretion protein [Ruminococcus sp.]MDE7138370.1 type VI secretion protein [Ruminococcus sp.]
MDKETLNRRISAGNFVENNGSVLRTVNLLKTKYNKLKSIQYALNNIDQNEISNSVNYLYEAGYLHLRHTESKQPSSLADDDFDELEGKLTAKGIQLLAGVISDECVEI